MDSIGLSPQIKLPTSTTQSVQSASAPSVPDYDAVFLPKATDNSQVTFDAHAVDQSRTEAVLKAAQQVANVYVLGDQTFSLFKDPTGQYITRFTNLQDGKVTYIPEPTLLELSGHRPDTTKPVYNITA